MPKKLTTCPNPDNNPNCKGMTTSKKCRSCASYGSSNGNFGIGYKKKWIELYGEEETDRKISRTYVGMSGEENPNYRKGFYKHWVNKYGKVKADILLNNFSNERSKQYTAEGNPNYGKPGAFLGKKRPEHAKKMQGENNPMYENGHLIAGEKNGEVKRKLSELGITYDEYLELKGDKYIYYKEVLRVTNGQAIEKLPNFSKRGKSGANGAYHLDHKYSISKGFENNVSPELIGSIHNLEFIPWQENNLKKGECSISLLELENLRIKQYFTGKLNN